MPFADYDDFDACVRANQDVDDPEAYCASIKRKVEGKQALSEKELNALEDSDCKEGYVSINEKCVPVEETDGVPPSALDMSAPRVLETRNLEIGPVEREELSNGKVKYKNIALLAEGIWTDAGSKQPTLYDPHELEVVKDNTVNIAHDSNNEVSEVGHIEADSWTVEGDKGYADIVLDMDSPASEYADENLQTALESGGKKGFGGPSIEIPAGSYDLEEDAATGYPKVVNGEINGAGLVMDPASKTTSFAHQVSQQGVAMSADSQNPMVFTLEDGTMSEETKEKILAEVLGRELQMGDIQDDAKNIADELDVPVDEVMEVLDPLLDMEEEEEEPPEEDVENEDDEPPEDETEDNPEEEEDDMEERMNALEERLSNIEEMAQQSMQAEDVDEELEEAKQDLADADTVAELKEAKDDLEKRLSELEDQPKDPKSLSEDNSDDWYDADSGVSHHSATGSTSF